MPNLLVVVASLFALGSLVFFVGGVAALRKKRLVGAMASLTLALLLFALGALCATISVATQGYRAFTREVVAAVVDTRPTGSQTFEATFRMAGEAEQSFRLAGDQLYVDARILKWKPIANLLGLHTAYELDRVSGRYVTLADEQQQPRTVFSLATPKRVDLFALRRRLPLLAPLVDTEYGSATFVVVDGPSRFEVRVSTTGLLARRTP